jgi:hypothetical protein
MQQRLNAPLPRQPGFLRALRNLLLWLLLTAFAVALLTLADNARAAGGEPAEPAERLQVVDTYLELHTGPGRGFPIFHSVEKGQWITVELRQTDWVRVRTASGHVGWAARAQIEATLTTAGTPRRWRDVLLDDYLVRRVDFGGAWGRFKGDPMLKLWLHARLAETVGLELAAGQVQGAFSGTEFWHLSLVGEPWADQRWSPYFSIGLGRFGNAPNASLVDAIPTRAKLAQASLGLKWHVADRYVLRLETTLHTAFASDQRSTETRSFSAGLGFFF